MSTRGPAGRLHRVADRRDEHGLEAGAPAGIPAALSLDLLATVLASGASPQSALLALADALDAAGGSGAGLATVASGLLSSVPAVVQSADQPAGRPNDVVLGAVTGAFVLAARSGLPPAELLRAAAARERSRQSMHARALIRRVEVLLVIPAGICLLPAFVLLGVAPVVIALFSSR